MDSKKIISLLLFLFLFTINAHSQTTYDFSTNATISGGAGGFGIWNTQANVTIGGVDYILTSGGNGSFINSTNGGLTNSKCLKKDGSGGDSFTLKRVDGQAFQFYGIWVWHQSMNSYSEWFTLPPWYTLSATGNSYTYQDMTAITAGTAWNNYTSSSKTISSGSEGIKVTSVQISFQAILFYAIDNIIVGPAISPCTAPIISSNPSNQTICNSNNTTFSSTATGATAYQWQVDAGSGFADVSNGGVYSNATTSTLTITAATAGMNGYQYRCKAINGTATCFANSNSGTLTISNISTASGSQTNVACNGGSNGSASVTPTGGTPGYTYFWSPSGGTAATATGLTAGSYTVTITGANSCTATRNFTITQPTAISTSTASQTNVSCNGGSNGSASVTPSGGSSGYTYSWSPSGGTAATASGLSAGTYTVTVTDANSCQASRSFTITQPAALSTSTASQTNVSCNGGSNGSASVSPTGGTSGYTYSWSPSGGTAATASGLRAGTYTVTITDANSCTATRNFTITQPTAISLTAASQTNISCNGGSTGAASVKTSTGGAGGYIYNWTPGNPAGDGTISVSGLTAGDWYCTVTDANGCDTTQKFTVTQPPAILVTPASQTNVSCFGGSNGAATITVSGGTVSSPVSRTTSGPVTTSGLRTPSVPSPSSYTYSWSPSGGTAATATGLTAGTYTVTVTDATGCTANQSFTITQPANITATATQTNVACNGGSNGSASVSPSGGSPGYTYSWSPSGGTAATATGLSAGSYTVTITDANACIATRNFTITQPTAISISTAAQTNVSCKGGSNGSASVTPTGGTPGYTYSWSPSGGTAAAATGLTAGNYTVTITDANSCTATRNFTITQPTAISISIATQTNVSCNGGSTGSASVTPTGGTAGYTYSWSPSGGTAATATGLTAGSYTVTITDANSCTATRNFTITQPTAISTSTAAQTNVSCNGGSNGSASVTPTGGTPGYTYSWSPSGGTAATATGLTAGSYTVTITDANACTATRNFTITQPTALSISVATQTNVSCNGGSNGSALVIPSGGISGYTYSWSPSGGTAPIATGLTAGSYTVTITDANSCTATRNVTITQPTALSISTASQTNVACNGGSNGSASVTPTGGTAGYTYSWSPSGGTAATATGLTAGSYTVTITDANSCIATRNFTITQPTAISISTASQTNVACNGGSTGSASVTPTGGTAGYTYSWSPSGGTAATATGLTAGSYTVTITDANSCTATRNFTITQPTAINASTAQTNVSCNGGSNGSASVTPTGGTPGYTYSWSPSGGTAATATGLTAGTYTCTITDSNSCPITKNFTITEPNALVFTNTTVPGYDYNLTYSENIIATGGTGAKTYAVTAGSLPSGFALSTTGQITGTSAQIANSNFTITVTDANSCKASFNFVLKLNQMPITITATATQAKVYGTLDPVLTYTVTPSLLSGDSFTGSLTRVTGENIGNYTINIGTLSAGSKYLVTYVSKDFAITAKPITVIATASQTKIYGTIDPTFAYSVSPSLVGSDAFTGALSRVSGENIGTYTVAQGTVSAGSNYTITYVGTNFAITAKPITVTAAAAQTKVYGVADPTFTYSVLPSLVGNDAFTGALSRVSGENVGTYTVAKGTVSAGSNYAITYVGTDFAITAKPITVTAAASQTKVYGLADPTFTYSVTPSLIGSDVFTGTLTRVSGENVGAYAVAKGTLSAGSNYTITYVGKDFAITAKPITVTAAASQTKVYGTAESVFAYSVSPALVGSDVFTGALTRATGENVGTYAIAQGTLSAGSNYTIAYVPASFSITKANQIILWNQTLGLGCDGETTAVLTATSTSGLAVSYTSANANIATISNSLLVFKNYGSTTFTASQAGNNNYNAASIVVLPVVNSQPNLIRKQFEDIIFFDNSSYSFKSYTWYKNGVLVPNQTAQHYKENGALNGIYYALATKLDGTLITTCPLTLSPTVEEEHMKIVPNPVKPNASYELLTNVSSLRLKNARIEVFSIAGLLVTTTTTNQNTVTLNAPTVEGIYIVKMTLANGKYFTKNILVKN